jgi:hypothetical protein
VTKLKGLLGMEVSVIVLSSCTNEIWIVGTLVQKMTMAKKGCKQTKPV